MGTVAPFKKKDNICHFCGVEPDHKGYWACPRLSAVSMDPDGTWAVEFFEPEVEFIPDYEMEVDDASTKTDGKRKTTGD